MKKVLIGFVSALLLSAPTMGKAETLMVQYYSLLGPADAYNSRGQPLNDLFAIGLVTLTFRSLNSFMRPFVQMPRGFCRLATSGVGAGYRTH